MRPWTGTSLRMPSFSGFWDYTTPGAGGMECFGGDDYRRLLDDMSRAGMNSICVLPKWLTTGYRSRLPFLDQQADNPGIRSDNQLMREFLLDARKRGMRTWLGACIAMYATEHMRSPPSTVFKDDPRIGLRIGADVGMYNIDCPEVWDYGPRLLAELCAEFPGIAGLVIEVEWAGVATPDRIALYDRWAREHGQPPFAQLNQPLNLRAMDMTPWRQYTTWRRIDYMRHLRKSLPDFSGEWAMICETGRVPYLLTQEVDLGLFGREIPWCSVVSYEVGYDKSRHRLGMMELAVEEVKLAGLKSIYLPRGVMTWDMSLMSIALEENWRRDAEDVQRFAPDGCWWFGAGCVAGTSGWHVDHAKLRQAGFADGDDARRRLIESIAGYA